MFSTPHPRVQTIARPCRVTPTSATLGAMASRYLLRWLGNCVNLSTPTGLLVAWLGGCRVRTGPRGLILAEGYRPRFPLAGAFTVGNVILLRGRIRYASPDLLDHEDAHAWQYLFAGPLFLPLYLAAMGWSWLRSGDRAAYNWFERSAGLARGGYRSEVPLRRFWTRA